MSSKHYKVTTRLVHGPEHSAKWDFTHHVTPPLSSSTTYRLDSARRRAGQGELAAGTDHMIVANGRDPRGAEAGAATTDSGGGAGRQPQVPPPREAQPRRRVECGPSP